MMKIYQSSNILNLAFSRIKKQNSSISIRGLAIKLGISHVFLSKVLAGKSPVPESRLKSFIKIFQLDSLAEKELKDAMIADLSVSEKIDKILQFKKNTKKKKTIEFFQEQPLKHQSILENWYELPILEYLTCEELPKDTVSIAQAFSLKPSQVTLALNKMSEAQLVKINENGQWVKITNFIRFPANTPSSLLKKYYTDVLKRTAAELAKSTQEDYNRRLIINFSIATNAEKIQEAKQRLSQFLYNLSLEMSDTHSNEVYHLTLGLVPLTPPHHEK